MADEGALVTSAAVEFRQRGFQVVVARPKQARVYFSIGKLRKGPDLVAIGSGVLVVLEAKVRASHLLRSSGGTSDAEAMRYLCESSAAQEELVARIDRSVSVGIERESLRTALFVCGLLSARSPTAEEAAEANELAWFEVSSGRLRLVRRGSLPKGCMGLEEAAGRDSFER